MKTITDTKDLKKIENLSNKMMKAVQFVMKTKFEIETLISLQEVKAGKVTEYKNGKDMFKKLGLL